MRKFLVLAILLSFGLAGFSQTNIYVRNSTWQYFEVEAGQYGTFTMSGTEWSGGDPVVRPWLETTGQQILSVNRTNTAVPEGDTAYFDVSLNGSSDYLIIKLRVIGVQGGTELAYSVSGNGFVEPWFDDLNFHEVQTTLAGKDVIIKFKPDNDDSNQDQSIRFAIHDLPVYELDEQDYQNPNVLNAMFYNIQMISFGVSGMPQANERAALLPAQLSPYQDVACFTEAFDDAARESHLIPAMVAAGFPYRTEILNEPGGILPFPVNGGAIIFSRWPIEVEDEIEFAECGQSSADCLASKGVKYARINKLGKRYHIFGTHMDAGSDADDIFARRTQMAEIRDFIHNLSIPEHEPVILGGDFNTSPLGDDDYIAFLDTMSPIIPEHIGYWESNFSDVFGNIIDHAWGDRTHLVPTSITNEIITVRSLDPILWDLSEFSDHRCVLGRYIYPDFEKSGGDTLVCPGETVSMNISTTFNANYQWIRNGQPISGATDASYDIQNAQESQSGHYTCLVSYDVIYGNWTDSITPLFFPDGVDTVEANLEFDFGEVVVDQSLCELSIGEAFGSNFKVFPNPADDIVNIHLEENIENAQVSMFSIGGELVFSSTSVSGRWMIDVSRFNPGIYLIELVTDEVSIHERVVVY